MYNDVMDYRPFLEEILRAGDMTQSDLAKRVGVTQPTVSRWMKGQQPELDQHRKLVREAGRLHLPKIVAALSAGEPPVADHIESSAILPEDEESPDKWTEIVGYVGAGARAYHYAVGHGALERVPRPEGANDKTVAVQIMGDSLGELFDRWLVFYDEVRRPITQDLIGKLCVVGLPDDRVLIKKVRRSKKGPGAAFDLLSNNEPPIEGVDIAWAAKVLRMAPR